MIEAAARDEFMEILTTRARKMVVGDPLDMKTRMGSLVSEEQMNRVLSYVEKGKSEGAHLLVGGERIGDRGYFVGPTVFGDVKVAPSEPPFQSLVWFACFPSLTFPQKHKYQKNISSAAYAQPMPRSRNASMMATRYCSGSVGNTS